MAASIAACRGSTGGFTLGFMTMPHAEILTALADDLRAVAELPAEEAVLALGRLADARSPGRVSRRLGLARQAAARVVVAEAGAQCVVAQRWGVSEQALSKLLRTVF